eukprot:jgi/Galph1/6046/GphlegSOOS_G4742.1
MQSSTKKPLRVGKSVVFDTESFDLVCDPKRVSITFEFDPKRPSFETQFVYSPQEQSKLFACYNFERERFRYLGTKQKFQAFQKDNWLRFTYFPPRDSVSLRYHIQADEKNQLAAEMWFHDFSDRGIGKREDRLELQSSLEGNDTLRIRYDVQKKVTNLKLTHELNEKVLFQGEYSYFSKDSQAAAVSLTKRMDQYNSLKAGVDWRNRRYLLEWTSETGDGPWIVNSNLGFAESLRDLNIQLKRSSLKPFEISIDQKNAFKEMCYKKIRIGFCIPSSLIKYSNIQENIHQFFKLDNFRCLNRSFKTSVFRRWNRVASPLVLLRCSATGTIQYRILEGDTKSLLVEYRPPKQFFRQGQELFYVGGYNNWDGSDSPLTYPVKQKDSETYEISVPLFETVRSVEFSITDGVVYDTNNGAFFHIPIAQESSQTTLASKSNEEEKQIIDHSSNLDIDPLKIPEGPTKYTTEEEISLRTARAEATTVGESMGLSNVLLTEARIEFERFDTQLTGYILPTEAQICLQHLGFEITDERFYELLQQSKQFSQRNDMNTVHIVEYMYMYGTLELQNEGLEMV